MLVDYYVLSAQPIGPAGLEAVEMTDPSILCKGEFVIELQERRAPQRDLKK